MVASEFVNIPLFQVFWLVAVCWILWWLADFKSFWNFWNLQVLGFSPSRHQFMLRLYISGRNRFLVVSDQLILDNCLVTSADVWWRFHWGDLRLMSQDSSFQSRLIISFDWLWSFIFDLAVSDWRSFQQVCFLYEDELFQANVPVTQVWRPHVRTWGLSEANIVYWRKYFWHYWDFSATLAVIRRPGNCAPPLPPPRYAPGCENCYDPLTNYK